MPLEWLIPIVTPILIALLKRAVTAIPTSLLPWIAPAIGALCEMALHAAGAASGLPPGIGAFLGAAGVGVREALDQTKKALAQ
jgi:hypothetical protein